VNADTEALMVILPAKQRPGCPVLGCRDKPVRFLPGWKKYGGKLCKRHALRLAEPHLILGRPAP
jgi:hypothetical protein